MELFSLEGKVALVTGAGRGIGRGIAEGLAGNGAKIAAAARTRAEPDDLVTTLEAAGDDALAVEMDVSDLASAASDYVTGQLIYVDGGFELGEDWPIDPPNS